jgi:hypothetical protein
MQSLRSAYEKRKAAWNQVKSFPTSHEAIQDMERRIAEASEQIQALRDHWDTYRKPYLETLNDLLNQQESIVSDLVLQEQLLKDVKNRQDVLQKVLSERRLVHAAERKKWDAFRQQQQDGITREEYCNKVFDVLQSLQKQQEDLEKVCIAKPSVL